MRALRRQALLLVTAGLVACGGPALSTAVTSPSVHQGPGGTARVEPARLWVQQGSESGVTSIALVDTSRPQPTGSLPDGIFTQDRSRLYAVSPAGAAQALRAIDTATGASLAITSLPSGFSLQQLDARQGPTGLSPDGHHLVLCGQAPAADVPLAKSSFLVYDTQALQHTPQRVDLKGSFRFDGISNDGHNLFLLEDLGSSTARGSYHVRRYDLVAHGLDPAVIADKRTGERSMSGASVDMVNSRDGAWQFTVYAFGAGDPFVHALNLDNAFSFCIDLPNAPRDGFLDLLWGLAARHDGRSVYAVNAANGAVVEMPVDTPFRTRSGTFPAPAPATPVAWTPWAPITAEAKRVAYGSAAISPDDRSLYGLGELGIRVIDTTTLRVRQSLVATKPLVSLTLTADGRRLYAATADNAARLLQISTQDGGWVSIAAGGQPLRVLHVVG